MALGYQTQLCKGLIYQRKCFRFYLILRNVFRGLTLFLHYFSKFAFLIFHLKNLLGSTVNLNKITIILTLKNLSQIFENVKYFQIYLRVFIIISSIHNIKLWKLKYIFTYILKLWNTLQFKKFWFIFLPVALDWSLVFIFLLTRYWLFSQRIFTESFESLICHSLVMTHYYSFALNTGLLYYYIYHTQISCRLVVAIEPLAHISIEFFYSLNKLNSTLVI